MWLLCEEGQCDVPPPEEDCLCAERPAAVEMVGSELLKAVPVGSPPAEDEGVARECPICLNEVRSPALCGNRGDAFCLSGPSAVVDEIVSVLDPVRRAPCVTTLCLNLNCFCLCVCLCQASAADMLTLIRGMSKACACLWGCSRL